MQRAGSPASAHSLAVLAVEEAAKAVGWHELVRDGGGDVVVVQESHDERLARAHRALGYVEAFYSLLADPDFQPETAEQWGERIRGLATSDNAMKQRGFYVDVDADRVLEPSEISAADAREAISVAHRVLQLADLLIA